MLAQQPPQALPADPPSQSCPLKRGNSVFEALAHPYPKLWWVSSGPGMTDGRLPAVAARPSRVRFGSLSPFYFGARTTWPPPVSIWRMPTGCRLRPSLATGPATAAQTSIRRCCRAAWAHPSVPALGDRAETGAIADPMSRAPSKSSEGAGSVAGIGRIPVVECPEFLIGRHRIRFGACGLVSTIQAESA